MNQNSETRSKLLQSAKIEFTEKGYMNASLRNICKNAGVTTGALYFFFKDKNELFAALTKDIVESLYQLMQEHFLEEMLFKENEIDEAEIGNDISASRMAIHQMYMQRDDILLVLTKSQGSSMERIVDRFVEETEKHYHKMAEELQRDHNDMTIDMNFIHWLAHMQIDSFIYMITHIEEEEAALSYMEQVIMYMINGWHGVFETKDW